MDSFFTEDDARIFNERQASYRAAPERLVVSMGATWNSCAKMGVDYNGVTLTNPYQPALLRDGWKLNMPVAASDPELIRVCAVAPGTPRIKRVYQCEDSGNVNGLALSRRPRAVRKLSFSRFMVK